MARDEFYNIDRILEEMEIKLFQNYKRAMMKDIDKPAKQWRELQIINIQNYKKQNKKIIEYYNKLLDKELKKSLIQSYREGAIAVQRQEEMTEQYFIDKTDSRKINSLLNAVHHDFQDATRAAMRQCNDIYRKNIFKSMVYYDSGTLSLKQSVDMASLDFVNKGLNSIEYSNGRKVDIVSYCDMALRTNSHRTKVVGESTQAQKYDIVTAYVSRHGSSCPLCAQYEGIFVLDDVNNTLTQEQETEYKDLVKLSEAMDGGLFHPNCRHSLIYQDVNDHPENDNKVHGQSEEEKELYRKEQEQRSLEREIRKAKREAVAKLDPTSQKEAAGTVKALQKQMREFLSENSKLVRRYDRENDVLTRG